MSGTENVRNFKTKATSRKSPRPSPTPDEKNQIIQERMKAGLSVLAIARKHNIAPSAVYRYLSEAKSEESVPRGTVQRSEAERLRELVIRLTEENLRLRDRTAGV